LDRAAADASGAVAAFLSKSVWHELLHQDALMGCTAKIAGILRGLPRARACPV